LSVPNTVTGGLLKKGPSFLKRYFVASKNKDLAPVLPYKPINETMVNLLLKESTVDVVDCLLSSIGQAWDTQGTNPLAYKYVSYFYSKLTSSFPVVYPRDALL